MAQAQLRMLPDSVIAHVRTGLGITRLDEAVAALVENALDAAASKVMGVIQISMLQALNYLFLSPSSDHNRDRRTERLHQRLG